MQMLKRLLLVVLLTLFVSGCAKLPAESLQDVRSTVASAYANGANNHAPGEYQLASSALQAAELQVQNGEYSEAARTLELAKRYSVEALKLTLERKEQLVAEEKKKAAEKQLVELKKQQALKLQVELKKEKERKKKAESIKAKKVVPVVEKKVEVVEPVLVDEVEVMTGENLATIATRPEVYADPLLWPLIYKANRDQIKDPEEIFAGQMFLIPRDKSLEEAEAARLEAQELNLFLSTE